MFKYLESVVQKKGELEKEFNHRITAGWMNWKWMTGTLCDRRISVKLKGKAYKMCTSSSIVRSRHMTPKENSRKETERYKD